MPIALPPPQLLEIAGADAVAFAHGQFCNDLRELRSGHWQWNAWLSPQGRVRAFFHLLRSGDEQLYLVLRGGDAQALRDGLARYILRSKVSLRVDAGVRALGIVDRSELGSGDIPERDRFVRSPVATIIPVPGESARWLVLEAPANGTAPAVHAEHWRLLDIRAGLPEIGPALADEFLPQWIGLERLGAVSVRKGCYPGQEIMSRLHFKGGNKRSLYRMTLATQTLPRPGTLLRSGTDGASLAGTIVMAAPDKPGHAEALATLSEAEAESVLHVDGTDATAVRVVERFD